MIVSASIMSLQGAMETKLEVIKNIPKDLIHVDFSDDYELIGVLSLLVQSSKVFDLHIISENAAHHLNELKKHDFLEKPKYVFVQLENLQSSTNLEEFLSDYSVCPAIQVESPVKHYAKVIKKCSAILLMTSTPGISGGAFNKKVYGVIKEIRLLQPNIRIYVDGGVSNSNYGQLVALGVHTVVIGSYLTKGQDFKINYNRLTSKVDLKTPLIALSDPLHVHPYVTSPDITAVLSEMVKRKSNYVLILSNNLKSLNGVLTDGDIKRQLQAGVEKFVIKPSDFKTNNSFKSLSCDATVEDLVKMGLSERRYGVMPLHDANGNIFCAVNLNTAMD